ncbi:MAG: ATP-binding protein, partial [Verrucomicrobiota bacterium]
NALKFTERGGVVVETGWVAEDSRGLRVRLAVRDTGPGLDPGTLARLFQPFTQAESSTHRRHGGAGLGLSICRCLAELMGGTLGADSQPGQGSTFWVELPFPRPAEAAAGPDETGRLESAAGPAAAGPRLPGCAVLVVDDQRVNLELAGGLLRQEGAIPTLMEDPQEALACLRREPHRFHAVLMDGQMPGLSGAETTRALRQEPGLQTLPIIAFTAAVLPAQVEEARAAGANDFVPKPVDAEQLVAVLRRWIRPRQDPAGTARAPRSRPVDTTPFPAVQGIDTAHAALRLRHDVQLFQTLREEFRREFSAVVTELREDLAQGRRENARRRLHTLVGTAGSLGALDLARAARDLQEALKDGAPA